jgi:hypothetical protein
MFKLIYLIRITNKLFILLIKKSLKLFILISKKSRNKDNNNNKAI